jgi:hypothetical protein
MRLKLSVLLLSICGLSAVLPAQVHAFDGVYLADREGARQDRRDAREARRAKRGEQQEQRAEPIGQERRGSERGYGYGYERRRYEEDDSRGRR